MVASRGPLHSDVALVLGLIAPICATILVVALCVTRRYKKDQARKMSPTNVNPSVNLTPVTSFNGMHGGEAHPHPHPYTNSMTVRGNELYNSKTSLPKLSLPNSPDSQQSPPTQQLPVNPRLPRGVGTPYHMHLTPPSESRSYVLPDTPPSILVTNTDSPSFNLAHQKLATMAQMHPLAVPTTDTVMATLLADIFLTKVTRLVELGKTSTGASIFKGTWQGASVIMRPLLTDKLRQLRDDIVILKNLRHPNIVIFFGLFQTPGEAEINVVTEYMEHGSLTEFLKSHNPEYVYKQQMVLFQQQKELKQKEIEQKQEMQPHHYTVSSVSMKQEIRAAAQAALADSRGGSMKVRRTTSETRLSVEAEERRSQEKEEEKNMKLADEAKEKANAASQVWRAVEAANNILDTEKRPPAHLPPLVPPLHSASQAGGDQEEENEDDLPPLPFPLPLARDLRRNMMIRTDPEGNELVYDVESVPNAKDSPEPSPDSSDHYEDRPTARTLPHSHSQSELISPIRALPGSLNNHSLPVLSSRDLVKLSRDIAAGMMQLEQKSFAHKNLSAGSVLVGGQPGNLIAKISDFGLTRHTEFNPSPRYTAPEALQTKKFTTRSDLWSFGVCLFEIFSYGKLPYDDMTEPQVLSWLLAGNRLHFGSAAPPIVQTIAYRCWDLNPAKRPTFDEIYELLDQYLQSPYFT